MRCQGAARPGLLDADEQRCGHLDRAARQLGDSKHDAEGTQGSVRHAGRRKPPGMGLSGRRLPEVQRLPPTEIPSLDARDARHDRCERIGHQRPCRVRQPLENARRVAAVPPQQLSGIGQLYVGNEPGIDVVDHHARQRVEDGPELRQARRCQEKQAVGKHRRRQWAGRAQQCSLADVKAAGGAERTSRRDVAPLLLHEIAALRPGAHAKAVEPRLPAWQVEVQPNGKVVGMTAGAPTNLLDRAALAQGEIERAAQRIGHEG